MTGRNNGFSGLKAKKMERDGLGPHGRTGEGCVQCPQKGPNIAVNKASLRLPRSTRIETRKRGVEGERRGAETAAITPQKGTAND